MLKTYQGSCHCGAVRFEADIDLAQGTNKCNCTICTKTRNWNVIIKPDAFRLLSGEDALDRLPVRQQGGSPPVLQHCGVRSFERGYIEGDRRRLRVVKLAALDDVNPQELIDAPVRHANGRDNSWWTPPTETRHL